METSLPTLRKSLRPQEFSATRLASTTVGFSAADPESGLENDHSKMDLEKVAAGVLMILEGIGESPTREGLIDTPSRVARMFQEMLYGTGADPGSEITCTFEEDTDEYVLVKDIPFASTCEHHLVPFIGLAHVAYIPNNGKITGLSKLARVVELASRRLQVQERMTAQIGDAIEKRLQALGVLVVLEAEHFCMSVRGVRKPGSKTITTALRGRFKSEPLMRAEVMSLIRNGVV